MVTQAEISTRRFTLPGFILTLIGGTVAAVAAGYAYFFIATQLQFDVIIVIAALLGAAGGWIVGLAARIGRFRSAFMLILLGFLFGVAGYGGRYYFEFNDFVAYVVEEETTPGTSVDEIRQAFLEFWVEEYPPGGFLGQNRRGNPCQRVDISTAPTRHFDPSTCDLWTPLRAG